MKPIDRRTADLIARAVVSGRRGYGKEIDGMADHIASLMKNRLEAVGVRGAGRAQRAAVMPTTSMNRPAWERLLARVEKHLAHMA